MAKSKYGTHVKPRLSEILSWVRCGMIDEDVATNLGVAYSTFRKYRDEHEELAQVLLNSKSYANGQIINALYDKAHGFVRPVKEPFKVKREYYDENGKKCTEEIIQIIEVEKYYPPEFPAQGFWLKNRLPADWQERLTANIKGELDVNMKLEELL